MSKHTPGPWRYEMYPTGFVIESDHSPKRFSIADVHMHVDPAIDPGAANARLIAAAPELLASLKDIFEMLDEQILVRNTDEDHKPEWALRMVGVVARLRAAQMAIAAAEGRT